LKELQYPFDPEYISKKKKSIKRTLLEQQTQFIEKRIAILGGSTTNNIMLQYGANSPLKRNLMVSEVVPSMRFLLSDDADRITGQNLGVTGGIS
jgi:NAD(P)-dependent dehydrogenase (short-subunit alcohol dehydrogenase family)